MEIKPIRTKADHRAALKEIEALMSARPGTPGGDRLDVLVTLVEAWEHRRIRSASMSTFQLTPAIIKDNMAIL
jgi:antitoxin component HigA of HigAB toxin-antitoxin module